MNENDKKKNESQNKPSGSEFELKDLLSCSFCAKKQSEVRQLIAADPVYICNECVLLCVEILDKDLQKFIRAERALMEIAR